MSDRTEAQIANESEKLWDAYRTSRTPITVNFRELVPSIPYNSERYTHQIHPYPAKLIPHIPYFFLNCPLVGRPAKSVLDPFCGSGTVLVEAIFKGKRTYGADSNPLAELISRVKTTSIEPSDFAKHVAALRQRSSRIRAAVPPQVINLDKWFYPEVTRQLASLRHAISEIRPEGVRNFALITFSQLVRSVSLADPRISVPVRLDPQRYAPGHWLRDKARTKLSRLRTIDVRREFFDLLDRNFGRLCLLSEKPRAGRLCEIFNDAMRLEANAGDRLSDESIDLVITSPPYLGAQKYIRASSLSLGWLGLCTPDELRPLEGLSIGREHYRKDEIAIPTKTGVEAADRILKRIRSQYPLRGHIAATYLCEMRRAITQVERVLSKSGHFVLIIGANTLCGEPFDTPAYVCDIAIQCGLSLQMELVDTIRSRGLMTKRNKTAGIIPTERVLVFRKS